MSNLYCVEHPGNQVGFVCINHACQSRYQLLCHRCRSSQHGNHLSKVLHLVEFSKNIQRIGKQLQKQQREQFGIGEKMEMVSQFKESIQRQESRLLQIWFTLVHSSEANRQRKALISSKLGRFVSALGSQDYNIGEVANNLQDLKSVVEYNYSRMRLVVSQPEIKDYHDKQDQLLDQVVKLSSSIKEYLVKVIEVFLTNSQPQVKDETLLLQEYLKKKLNAYDNTKECAWTHQHKITQYMNKLCKEEGIIQSEGLHQQLEQLKQSQEAELDDSRATHRQLDQLRSQKLQLQELESMRLTQNEHLVGQIRRLEHQLMSSATQLNNKTNLLLKTREIIKTFKGRLPSSLIQISYAWKQTCELQGQGVLQQQLADVGDYGTGLLDGSLRTGELDQANIVWELNQLQSMVCASLSTLESQLALKAQETAKITQQLQTGREQLQRTKQDYQLTCQQKNYFSQASFKAMTRLADLELALEIKDSEIQSLVTKQAQDQKQQQRMRVQLDGKEAALSSIYNAHTQRAPLSTDEILNSRIVELVNVVEELHGRLSHVTRQNSALKLATRDVLDTGAVNQSGQIQELRLSLEESQSDNRILMNEIQNMKKRSGLPDVKIVQKLMRKLHCDIQLLQRKVRDQQSLQQIYVKELELQRAMVAKLKCGNLDARRREVSRSISKNKIQILSKYLSPSNENLK